MSLRGGSEFDWKQVTLAEIELELRSCPTPWLNILKNLAALSPSFPLSNKTILDWSLYIRPDTDHRAMDMFANIVTPPNFNPHNDIQLDQQIKETSGNKSLHNEHVTQ